MIKMNNILGAGAFPKSLKRQGLLSAQCTMEIVAHYNQWGRAGGRSEEPTCVDTRSYLIKSYNKKTPLF